MPANTTFGLNTDSFRLRYHPNRNFDKLFEGDGQMPIDKDAVAQFIGWMGELTRQTLYSTGDCTTPSRPPDLSSAASPQPAALEAPGAVVSTRTSWRDGSGLTHSRSDRRRERRSYGYRSARPRCFTRRLVPAPCDAKRGAQRSRRPPDLRRHRGVRHPHARLAQLSAPIRHIRARTGISTPTAAGRPRSPTRSGFPASTSNSAPTPRRPSPARRSTTRRSSPPGAAPNCARRTSTRSSSSPRSTARN